MNFTNKEIEEYCIQKSNTPSSICNELETYTRENIDMSMMLVGKLEASLLGFLIRSHGVKTIVEFGTYTGYSALSMAEQLPSDGSIYTLDINPETTKLAQSYWDKSPHGNKIKSLVGPAINSFNTINEQIDLAFIDADKENYSNYLKLSLSKLNKGGLIVVDNVLWSGKVLHESEETSTKAIQELNNFVKNSPNLYGTLLPVRDGMFLIQKID